MRIFKSNKKNDNDWDRIQPSSPSAKISQFFSQKFSSTQRKFYSIFKRKSEADLLIFDETERFNV